MYSLELFTNCRKLLDKVLLEAGKVIKPDNLNKAFIMRHARYILGIGDDVALLYQHKTYFASSIAIRTMIESAYNIAAAVKVNRFAVQKTLAELEDMADRIRKNFKVQPGDEFSKMVDYYQGIADRIRRENNETSKAKWKVFECAEAAGLEQSYVSDYFKQNRYVHASIAGMIDHEHGDGTGDSLASAISATVIGTANMLFAFESVPQRNELFKQMLDFQTLYLDMGKDDSLYVVD